MGSEMFYLEQLCHDVGTKADLIGVDSINKVLQNVGYELVKKGN